MCCGIGNMSTLQLPPVLSIGPDIGWTFDNTGRGRRAYIVDLQ